LRRDRAIENLYENLLEIEEVQKREKKRERNAGRRKRSLGEFYALGGTANSPRLRQHKKDRDPRKKNSRGSGQL